jgi:hypothetical protein
MACVTCVFAIRVYLKAWINTPLAASAPYNDLLLLKALLNYSIIHQSISKATSEKLANHMWYLSAELVGLAFFDAQVNVSTKRLMVKALEHQTEMDHDNAKRITVSLKSFQNMNLEDFVTAKSMALFEKLDLPGGLLQLDPEMWGENEDFKLASETLHAMKVVNDHAERGVALIQEFSCLITRDESQLQYLLQVVQEHRRAYPDSRKQTLVGLGVDSDQPEPDSP